MLGFLWGIVFIKLIDMGRPSPLWVRLFPIQGDLNCMNKEMELRVSKQATHMLSLSLCRD